MPIRRRTLLAGAVAGGSTWGLNLTGKSARSSTPFDFETVVAEAEARAASPFVETRARVAPFWRDLSYDQHRMIRFRPDQALWRDDRLFSLQFFHAGLFFDHPVTISLVDHGQVSPLRFQSERFDYGGLDVPEDVEQPDGYAGFRVHFPINRTDWADEFAVFLGASYFRLIGRDQAYGLSARGLAVDTVAPTAEEFPNFTDFWIEVPAPDATELTIMALLDGSSVAGAYRFRLRPGGRTVCDVEAALFARRQARFGVAPLTSMFMKGEMSDDHFDDFRPEIHDSDGLSVLTANDEWLWRPLTNRRAVQTTSFMDRDVQGFGLFQRDRSFFSYQDLEARYDRRPSLWVEPLRPFGPGRVELVEIPTDREIEDNIVAYWVPDAPLGAGDRLDVSYRLSAIGDDSAVPPIGRVISNRVGTDRRPGIEAEIPLDGRLFVVDFAGGELASIGAEQPVEAVVEASTGRLANVTAVRNEPIRGWRVFFDLIPDGDSPCELRCRLALGVRPITETWSLLWLP